MGMATRSPEIPVREWWLILARQLLEADTRGLIQLGKDLQKHVGRAEPFSHSVISRFKRGEIGATLELAQALTIEFADLPAPVLFPESNEEALALMHTASRYRSGRGVVIDGPRREAPIVELPKPKKKAGRHAHPTSGAAHSKVHSRK